MTPTYTAEQIAAMSGVELSRIAAAVCMGWTCVSERDHLWVDSEGKERYIIPHDWSASNDFRPDVDHRHSAELRAKMVERWPKFVWMIQQEFGSHDFQVTFLCEKDLRPYGISSPFYFGGKDECRAVCVASILAAQTLGGME